MLFSYFNIFTLFYRLLLSSPFFTPPPLIRSVPYLSVWYTQVICLLLLWLEPFIICSINPFYSINFLRTHSVNPFSVSLSRSPCITPVYQHIRHVEFHQCCRRFHIQFRSEQSLLILGFLSRKEFETFSTYEP